MVLRVQKMAEIKKEIKYLPVFIALVCVYFSDVFFKGAVLVIGDGFDYFFPMMIAMSDQYRHFIFPFWNPQMFSGFPLFGSMQPGALYPFNVLFPLLFSPALAFDLNIMLHYSLAGFFTFLYARQIGLGTFPSLIAGMVFSLLGYFPAHLIHPSILFTGAWIPLLLFFYERLRREPNINDAVYASLVIALQVFAGHPQICVYTYLLLTLYVVFHLFSLERSKRARFAFLSILALTLGWAIALPQIVATYELAAMGERAKTTYEFFSSYAFPVHMLPTFLFPFFYYLGGSYHGEMWGPLPALGQEAFVGTLPFLLALLVMMRWKKNPQILFWGAVAILALALALGDAVRPLNELLFHLPGYNSFRGPSKHMLEMSFALSVLTGFGVSFLQKGEEEKQFYLRLIIVLFSVIALSFVTFTFFDAALRDFFRDTFARMHHFQLSWKHGSIPEHALSITDPSIFTPLLVMTAYLVCLIALYKAKNKYLRDVLLLIISFIIFREGLSYELGPVPDARAVRNYNKELYTILAADKGGRTAFFTDKVPPLTAIPYQISLSEGYDPLEIEDYKKMFPAMYTQSAEIWRILLENNSLLSMINAKYLVVDNRVENVADVKWWIVREGENGVLPIPPIAIKPQNASEYRPIYRKIASYPSFSLFENTIVLPRAHPVLSLKPVSSIDELMKNIFSFRMNPWREAAVSMDDFREIGTDRFSPGIVRVVEQLPDKVALTASFKGRGFIVLADKYYPGWEAYIDGRHSKMYRTNGVQRGVVVPEGEHAVVFNYVPRLIYASMAVSGIILVGILFFLFRRTAQGK